MQLFGKQQLLLRKPWRCEQNLKYNYETWKSAYLRSNIVERLQITMSLRPVEDENEFENNDDEMTCNDWMTVCLMTMFL